MKSLMAMLLTVIFTCTLAGAQGGNVSASSKSGFVPKEGYVPDETAAVAVAEAVLVPIYGREKIQSERPFHAKLESGTWTVEGSLPEGREGGVATVKLLKRDGRILSVIHGK